MNNQENISLESTAGKRQSIRLASYRSRMKQNHKKLEYSEKDFNPRKDIQGIIAKYIKAKS